MKPIEILNTIAERIFELRKEESKNDLPFTPFVDPSEYKEDRLDYINGQYAIISKEEYLKDCIGYFLLNVLALKKRNLLIGFNDARELVKTQNGFGKVDDINFTNKTSDGITRGFITKGFIIRIIGIDRPSLSQSENYQVTTLQSNYVIVSTMDEFYKWYVDNFGEVEVI